MELAKRRNRNNFNDTTHNLCHEAEVSPFLHSFLLLCRIFLFRGAVPKYRAWLAHRVSLISLLSKLLYNCSLVSHASTHWGVISLLASPRLHLASACHRCKFHTTSSNKNLPFRVFTGICKKADPRLCDSCVLASSGRGGAFHAT